MHLSSGLGLCVALRLHLSTCSLLSKWSRSLKWKEGLPCFVKTSAALGFA